MSKQTERVTHPSWCDQRYCKGVHHVSRQFAVIGDVPLVVELVQTADQPVARLSIFERDGQGIITISLQQAPALVSVLYQLALT